MTRSASELKRALKLRDAVYIGVGSMVGAGVFAAFGPAAQAAGASLLIGLLIALCVAFCNAVASAQLAAVYPTSGGTYFYGRQQLNEWFGFIAGWGFVIGKTASCAAMAITVAAYAISGPDWLQKLIGVAVVLGLTALNYRGVTRTAQAAKMLVSITLVCLALFVFAVLGIGDLNTEFVRNGNAWTSGGIHGILQSAGLLFFAFAGYARIATLGEEVENPASVIPKAILRALGIVAVIYALVAIALLLSAGPDLIATSAAPLVTAAREANVSWVVPFVRIGAVVAATGSLLSLIAGVSRTAFAMARNRDLPAILDAVHPRYQVPHHAEMAVAVIVCLVVLLGDIRGAIGFSSFGVLIYYSIANASAFTQPQSQRRWPRAFNVAGVAGCLLLVVMLPIWSVISGVFVLGSGLAGRYFVLQRRAES